MLPYLEVVWESFVFLMLSSYRLYRLIMYVPVQLGMVMIAFYEETYDTRSRFLIKTGLAVFVFDSDRRLHAVAQ